MTDILGRLREPNADVIAYKIGSDYITYGDLAESVERYARLLKKQGSEPVIVYGHKSIGMVISIISSLAARRAYIPIDVFTPAERIKNIISQTGVSLILANEPFNIETETAVSSLEGLHSYECCNEIYCGGNDTAYTIFTSGSTGIPKGVPISYSNLENFIGWISGIAPLCEYKGVRVLDQASFSFDLSVADLYYSICNGHTLVGLEKKSQDDLGDLIDVIRENDIAVTVTTPTFMKMCLLNDEFDEIHCPSLRCMYFCGEVLEAKTAQKIYNAFPDMKIINAYGPTEATSAIAGVLIDRSMLVGEYGLPVGKISEAAGEIEIVNGEIVLKGASVFSGYLDGSRGGHYTENGENCYRTGDIGFVQGDYLYFIGRADNQIKYKGYRIELGDIESSILKVEGVTACAVIAKFVRSHTVKMIKAFVVLEGELDEDYVRGELKRLVPPYMIPKTIKKIDRLPTNQNGKIDRKRLSEL